MTQRIQLAEESSESYQQLLGLHAMVEKAIAGSGLDLRLAELVKLRTSMLNGCAFCLDLHTRDARKLGETEQRIYLLAAWREAGLYTEQEQAGLALAEAMTRLSESQDVPDEVYTRAVSAFTEDQYRALAWAITVINAFNRLCVTSHKPLPGPRQQIPGTG